MAPGTDPSLIDLDQPAPRRAWDGGTSGCSDRVPRPAPNEGTL